jgi:hypothetical protein
MTIESFNEFVSRLRDISGRGFIETHRAGNTGIGKTLEDLLGIEENNIPGPDAAGVELKSTRRHSNNLTTLFTKEPPRSQRNLWNQQLVRRLGYEDSKGRQALKVTIGTNSPNNRGFYLSYGNDTVEVTQENYGVCATYPLDLLREVFERKLPELVLVIADVEMREGREHFWYNEAYHLEGFDSDDFMHLLRDGVITLDLRMHIKENGNIRNRGTAWRILDESRLDEAFEQRTYLLGETEPEDNSLNDE